MRRTRARYIDLVRVRLAAFLNWNLKRNTCLCCVQIWILNFSYASVCARARVWSVNNTVVVAQRCGRANGERKYMNRKKHMCRLARHLRQNNNEFTFCSMWNARDRERHKRRGQKMKSIIHNRVAWKEMRMKQNEWRNREKEKIKKQQKWHNIAAFGGYAIRNILTFNIRNLVNPDATCIRMHAQFQFQ